MGGRIRIIRTCIWTDDKFPFLSDDEKLIFFHLLTSQLANPLGIFVAGLASLADELRWDVERYRKGFRNLSDRFGVTFHEGSRTVLLKNHFKHNIPNNPNVWKNWLKFYPELPFSPLRDEWDRIAMRFATEWGSPFISILSETTSKGSSKRYPKPIRNVTPNLSETLPQTYPKERKRKGKGKGSGKRARACDISLLEQKVDDLFTNYEFKNEEHRAACELIAEKKPGVNPAICFDAVREMQVRYKGVDLLGALSEAFVWDAAREIGYRWQDHTVCANLTTWVAKASREAGKSGAAGEIDTDKLYPLLTPDKKNR